jgi:hypothetical protein
LQRQDDAASFQSIHKVSWPAFDPTNNVGWRRTTLFKHYAVQAPRARFAAPPIEKLPFVNFADRPIPLKNPL